MATNIDLSKYRHGFSLKNKIARSLWTLAYYCLFRPLGLKMFRTYRNLILRVFGASISKTATIHSSAKIWAPWNLIMKDYSTLGPKVDCYNQGTITIGSHTTISQKSYLCASSHDICDPYNNLILCPIEIADQVWVAADAFIGPNVRIGQGAVVGARSAVFKNVEPWTVVGGNPAKVLKQRILK